MYKNKYDFPRDIYKRHLTKISGIKFTRREIDVIAFLVSGRSAKKTGFFLSLSPKTVENYTRNIMIKLGCNSRENIIDFIEKSGKFSVIKEYYSNSISNVAFEKCLKNISALKGKKSPTCTIVHWKNSPQSFLIDQLATHLNLSGITTSVEIRERNITFGQLQDEMYEDTYVVYALPAIQTEELEAEVSIRETKAFEACQEAPSASHNKFFLILEGESPEEIQKDPKGFNYINLAEQKNYYCLVVEILKSFFPDRKKIIKELEEEVSLLNNISNHTIPQIYPRENPVHSERSGFIKTKKWKILSILMTCILCSAGFLLFYLKNNDKTLETVSRDKADKTKQIMRSDLIIPISTAFLERPEIIKKMNDCLKEDNGIQTIALTGLIGIGGAGKTTMARYFAKSISGASLVWELNAETKDTLMNSFRNLAYILANTTELKKDLDFIQKIQDPETQENLLLNFVRLQLKERSKWVLVYDNMESFSQINHLVPQDPAQWGNGKVIITTRNEHITETIYVKPKNIIHVDELSDQEMLALFSKILYDLEPSKLNKNNYDKVVAFLKSIPPFPLDVSVAAYSIKNTHVTFEKYLQHINEYSKNYENMQVKLMKEATDYDKTRYGIISSTVEKLSQINPHFKELFFFICLLDSQNIPHNLLENYNNNKMVDDLVYNLRKNGLLLRESYSNFDKERKVISLHRSTQEIGAEFLITSLTEKEKGYLIGNMIRAVNNFYQSCVKNKDMNNIMSLVPHLKGLLNAIKRVNISKELKNKYEADLCLISGDIHYKWTKNLALARKYFKIALEKDNNNHFSPRVLATLLKDLSSTCLAMGLLEESLGYCKKSIDLCRTFSDPEFILADNFQIIGTYYRKNNDFEKAHKFFEDALETISKVKNEDIKILKSEIYIQLSHLYMMHYLNKKEGQASEDYAIKALDILSGLELFYIKEKPLPPHISCYVARHRWKYGEVLMWHYANYDDAEHNLRESEYIMNHKCPGNMHLKGRMLGIMAEVLLRKGDLLEAENKAFEAINVLSIALGPNTTWTYNVIRAEIKIRLGKFKEGYEDCLKVFDLGLIERSNFHDLRYWMVFYNGAFAKYKLKDYQKSIKHFEDFLKGIDSFCKGFLDEKSYNTLKTSGVFAVLPQNVNNELRNIEVYLKRSLVIFTAILGKKHPFVQEYIEKNLS